MKYTGIRIFGGVMWTIFLASALYFLSVRPEHGTAVNIWTQVVTGGSFLALVGFPLVGLLRGKPWWVLVFVPFISRKVEKDWN
ncbi:MAG: hypothetical protein AAB902_02645 [Patescibacteria group bacterium]